MRLLSIPRPILRLAGCPVCAALLGLLVATSAPAAPADTPPGAMLPGLAFAATPAPAGSNRAEAERILEDLEDVITRLAEAGELNAEETYGVQRELAVIHRDLEALAQRLDSAPAGQPEPPAAPVSGEWMPYGDVTHETTPPGAAFDGWGERSDIDLEWGDYGELVLRIDTGYYETHWTIRHAYRGNASVNIQSGDDGRITIRVDDEDGSHEFEIRDGGLGAIYIRGRADGAPPKQVSPVD